ncbi:MAG: Efflux pump rane transporter BepE, partial [Pseudomonadota bacterium]
MQLAEVSIRRPVFATVLSLLVLLIGAVSFLKLPVREYPKIDEPVVTVAVKYAGASAEVIESQIAKVLEDSIAGIDAVDVITSISRAEQAQITVKFRLEKDADAAAAEVRDRTARVRNRLPLAIEEPVIAKVEADAFPVIWLAFSSDTHTPLQINELVNRIVKPKLQTVTGAADVRIFGERKYAMRVWLDPDRLAAYKLTVADAEDAIRRSNLEVPAGRIESTQREFSVTSNTDLLRPGQFGEIVIKNVAGFPVKMRDVARINEEAADIRSRVRLNGRDAISVGVIRQATANPLVLSKGVRDMMPSLQKDLPAGISVDVANDNSVFIERSVQGVYQTILEAIVLVALVIFLFLRTLRASIIPIVTIPVSLVGTFALMALAGFTINTLTLLALVLAIGLVVDDAIVVLENIYRHIEEGMDPFAAAIKGSKEIAFAVIAMTLTLAAVYAPLAFTPGRTGRLFIEFALALAGAVVVSGFIALTLTPMMCSILLKHNPKPGWFDRKMGGFLDALTNGYEWLLRKVLKVRWLVILVMIGVAVWIWQILPTMKRELAPMEDRGVILTVVNAPDGATIDYTNKYVNALERIGQPYKEFDRLFVTMGNPTVSQANVFYRTIPWEERKKTTMELAREMQPRINGLAGVTAFPITPPSLGQGFRERPVNFMIVTSDSYQNLAAATRQMMDEIAKNPGFLTPDIDLRLNKPELKIDVNREKAADLGVSVEVVARAIETMLGGRQVTRYKKEGDQYDVIVQTQATGRDTPDDIEKIFVRGRNDAMIPLASLVKVRESVA